jgi:hypothetical protein
MCPYHPQKRYEYYDEKCKRFICSDCVAVGAHVGHKCLTIEAHHSKCQKEFGEIEILLPGYISSLTQGEETTHLRAEFLTTRYWTLQLEIDAFAKKYLSERPQLREELQKTLKSSYATQGDTSNLHLQKVKELRESMEELLEHCLELKSRFGSVLNCCSLSLLDQLRTSYHDLKTSYESLRAFFRRASTDFDWSSRNSGLVRTDFTTPGTASRDTHTN